MAPEGVPESRTASVTADGTRRLSFAARRGAALAAGCTTLVLLLILAAFLPRRSLETAPPLPGSYFDDRAGWVSPEFAAAKNIYLQSYVLQALHLAVLVVIEPAAPAGGIEDYTIAAANAWKIGAQGADNGIVLFVFPSVRTVRLEIGYGVEGLLPDIEAKHLVEATLLPQFSAGRYEDGFEDFLSGLVGRLQEHADEAAKADKPIGMISFAIAVTRALPRVARQAWTLFQADDIEGRAGLALFAGVLGAAFGEGLFRLAIGIWALVQLPWRIVNARAVHALERQKIAAEFTAAQLARRPPPSLVALLLDLHAGEILSGAMALVAMVVGIAFLGLGLGGVIGGHGGFGGAGILEVWAAH